MRTLIETLDHNTDTQSHTHTQTTTDTHLHHTLYTHKLHIVCAHLLIMSPAILCCTFLSKRLDFIVHHVVATPRIAPLILPHTRKTLTPPATPLHCRVH